MKAPAFSSPEPLETRIAPAAVFTFTDVDGDLVKITTSLGTNAELEAAATVVGGQLYLLDLTAAVFQNTNVSASVVTKSATGDGRVNLGRINATGRDLGSVTIAGDLGDLDCGDADTATAALKSVSVRSLGLFGLVTQGGAGDLSSNVRGAIGALTVAGDFHEVFLFVDGGAVPANGRLGALAIGGSLVGGAGDFQGSIRANGDIGPIKIGGDLIGGGNDAGQILTTDGKIASVTIGGSLVAGWDADSGLISSGAAMGPVRIGGDVVGNIGQFSGRLAAGGKIASVTIGGSLLGGAGLGSGGVGSDTEIGPVNIGGNVVGLGADSAQIVAAGPLGTVSIGGSLVGGAGARSGTLIAVGDLGAVKIGGDVKGGVGHESGKIDAGGKITSVAIGGSLLGGGGNYDTITVGTVAHRGQLFSGGTLGLVKIGGTVQGGAGRFSASLVSVGAMTGVNIGGSLLGGAGDNSANIFTADVAAIGPVTIAHDVRGGAGLNAARILSNGALASVTIGGSLVGGAGEGSGLIGTDGATTGVVKIGHDLLGGTGVFSGVVSATAVTIGGSLVGGAGNGSGGISSFGADLVSVRIGHDLLGGSIPGQSDALDRSGYIVSDQRIGSVFIGGSIVSGTDGSGGVEGLTTNATIRAGRDLGSLTVGGGLIGNVTPNGESHVIISARGQATPGASTDVAIGKISIGGRVEWARILAGYDTALVPRNADAQIGSVTVGADFIASSIVAGAFNEGLDFAPGGTGLNADNVYFGNLADRKIVEAGELPGVAARIGRIAIAGQVYGTPESFEVEDQFGFVSEQIGALKVGVRTYPLTAGSGNDAFPVNWRTDTLGFGPNLHEFEKLDIGFSASVNDSARRVSASLVTYLDKDGDRAIVTLSKPLLTSDAIARDVFHFDTGLVGDAVQALQQLRYLDLRPLATNGLGVTITVLRGPVGDGLIHVGAIVSTGFDMGAIVVPGDLGQITGGATTAGKPGLASLNVRTLGRLGLDTQGPAVAGFSPKLGGEINGGLGTLTVKEDIVGANLDVGGAIGPVNIGGSLIGGDSINSGLIFASGTIGAVRIGEHLQGGFGQSSGEILSAASLASLSVGGSVLGGGGIASGTVRGGVLGAVSIGHNVRGGTNANAGMIALAAGAPVTLGGSLLGGDGAFSGLISAENALGAVKIGHNTVGGRGEGSGSLVGAKVASVRLGGSLLGGGSAGSGSIASLTGGDLGPVSIAHDVHGGSSTDAGKISAGRDLASVSIGGSLLGGSGANSGAIASEGNTTLVSIRSDLIGSVGSSSGTVFARARLDAVTLGGSLVGGSGSSAGGISADGGIGAVKIGRDVHGGSSAGESGSIFSRGGDLASVTIGGSLIGGAGFDSGEIFSTGDVGVVKIGGDVIGGATSDSGLIRAAGKLASATIGGSLFGGRSDFTGAILGAEIGTVNLGRNLVGGSIADTTGTLDQSGYLESQNRLAAITVGGSLFAGWDTSAAGSLTRNASIRAGDDLGAVVIRGSLHGHAGSPIIISATDEETSTATRNLAIKSLSIGGSVERALILAGYLTSVDAAETRTAFFDNTAQIGPVTVRGDWLASSLVAGILDFDNNGFGNGDDVLGVLGGGAGTIARIASIALGGVVAGTAAAGDHFGFTSVTIGAFKSLGYTAPLTPARDEIELSPTTTDVTLREF